MTDLSQRKLRHLVSISLRNLKLDCKEPFEIFYALCMTNSKNVPFYVSEIVESYKEIDFNELNLMEFALKDSLKLSTLKQLTKFQMLIFVRAAKGKWRTLEELLIDLNFGLMYLGQTTSLQSVQTDNAIIFHLKDGLYLVNRMSIDEVRKVIKNKEQEHTEMPPVLEHQYDEPVKASAEMLSFDKILKLNNLKLCINDIMKTNYSLTQNIADKLRDKPETTYEDCQIKTRMIKIKLIEFKKTINLLKKKNMRLKATLSAKHKHLNELKLVLEESNEIEIDTDIDSESDSVSKIRFDDLEAGEEGVGDVDETNQFNSMILTIDSGIMHLKQTYGMSLNKLDECNYETNIAKCKIFKILDSIFDIQPLASNPIEFEILSLRLSKISNFVRYPNYAKGSVSSADKNDEDIKLLSKEELQKEIDCALGYVSQLVNLISLYLLIPLKYPVIPYGSFSYVCDYVSNLKDNSNRMFPLHLTNNVTLFKFEYGLNLLNKDIEQLMNSQDLKVPDPKHILGNLKTLLLYLSSKT